MTLQTFFKMKRNESKPLSVITLELKKTFDSIAHAPIERALRRYRVDGNTAKYIKTNFEDFETKIICEKEEICEIGICREVKQGDPLSPILFTMVLDELIDNLRIRPGVKTSQVNVPVLGYADDLLLLSENNQDARLILKIAMAFSEDHGLKLNPRK